MTSTRLRYELDELTASEVRAEIAKTKISHTSIVTASHISRNALSRKVNGKSTFSIGELHAVARELGITAWELVRRAEEAAATKTLCERDLTRAALADDTHGAPPATASHGTRGARGRHSSASVSKEGSR